MQANEEVMVRDARASDLPAVLSLLEGAGLPTAGVAEWLPRFVVAEAEGKLAGAAGVEAYLEDGLLRSVVVAEEWRGRGLGAKLVARVLDDATRAGLLRVYLLTMTAEQYFPRLGFRRIAREEVSQAVQQSPEFQSICPSSAAVMVRESS